MAVGLHQSYSNILSFLNLATALPDSFVDAAVLALGCGRMKNVGYALDHVQALRDRIHLQTLDKDANDVLLDHGEDHLV